MQNNELTSSSEPWTIRQPALQQMVDENNFRVYYLRREPTHLKELLFHPRKGLCILQENDTIIRIDPRNARKPHKRYVNFKIDRAKKPLLQGTIYGKTDEAIAETATFFWSLKTEGISVLSITGRQEFDFSVLQSEQLARVLDSNPERYVKLESGTWTAEQAVVLATRPYPLNLGFANSFAFQDEGTAFIDALGTRQTSFGSLQWSGEADFRPYSRTNLERLLQLDVFEKLTLDRLDEQSTLLPFIAKAMALDYGIRAEHIRPDAFESLNVATNDLTLRIHYLEGRDDRTGLFVSFLDRVAELGHFEQLGFMVAASPVATDATPAIDALIRAVHGNPNLTMLNLTGIRWMLDHASHLQTLFLALENHKGLRWLVLSSYPSSEDPDCSWLVQLLTRNRNITVLDGSGKRINEWWTNIHSLYFLNYFFNGSASLTQESAALRPLLVSRALVDQASTIFQYTGLLLAHHPDVLCEWIGGMDLETDAPEASDYRKRKAAMQPLREAKRVTFPDVLEQYY